jgi:hypothetical protein
LGKDNRVTGNVIEVLVLRATGTGWSSEPGRSGAIVNTATHKLELNVSQ